MIINALPLFAVKEMMLVAVALLRGASHPDLK